MWGYNKGPGRGTQGPRKSPNLADVTSATTELHSCTAVLQRLQHPHVITRSIAGTTVDGGNICASLGRAAAPSDPPWSLARFPWGASALPDPPNASSSQNACVFKGVREGGCSPRGSRQRPRGVRRRGSPPRGKFLTKGVLVWLWWGLGLPKTALEINKIPRKSRHSQENPQRVENNGRNKTEKETALEIKNMLSKS